MPKVLFAGTPDFALVILKALVDAGTVPVAVLTQPDRPAGRGKRLMPGPVKQYAEDRRIPVMQPESLRDPEVAAWLGDVSPDIMVVAAYGLLLPQSILDIPAAGCLNVHASLLPRWRGAAPIQAAILAGDAETGVCLMQMTAGLDCGPVFACKSLAIGDTETAGELHDRLAQAGATLLRSHLDRIVADELPTTEQNEADATYAGKIRRQDALLDWRHSAIELDRRIRAYNPVPGAYFMLNGERIKCWLATRAAAVPAKPGTIVAAGKDGIVIACGSGSVAMLRLQRPGRKPVSAAEFAGQFDLVGMEL